MTGKVERGISNDTILPGLRSFGHVIRVENISETGTPDINYAFVDCQGWIETKIIHGSYLLFERFQLPWHARRVRATEGKHCWVIAVKVDGRGKAQEVRLYGSADLLKLPREPYRDWVKVHLDQGVPACVLTKPFNWQELHGCLARGE